MMKELDDIIKAIELCTSDDGPNCTGCPYRGDLDCVTTMDLNALEALKKYRKIVMFIQEKKKEAAS